MELRSVPLGAAVTSHRVETADLDTVRGVLDEYAAQKSRILGGSG